MPDTAETEYLRGKLQERTADKLHQHAPARFDTSGPSLWAARSGRTYYDAESPEAEAMDYSSPVTGNGKLTITHGSGMGNLSRVVGGKKRGSGLRHRTQRLPEPHPAHGGNRMVGGASDDYETNLLLRATGGRSHTGAARTGAASVTGGARTKRGQLVAKLMRERGVSLGQASKIIKEEGLM